MLTQLTELAVEDCQGVQASELAAALRGLRQLQVLELGYASCFDMECLLAVAGLQQLQQLWLEGDEGLEAGLGECWGMLHRCLQLQRVTLQRCGSASKGVVLGLLSKPGMQQLELRGAHGLAAEVVIELRALGAAQGCCQLLCEEQLSSGPTMDSEIEL